MEVISMLINIILCVALGQNSTALLSEFFFILRW